ncbi:Kelch-like protein 20 [Echinococcus granulosus]|uniref:Kelch-like protein 20 n=1 Tax=Echinococcus granulosus TaxID=6210 RepID=W6UDE9_ECHGR|nr:Kelch-like protein 20 [Echinococcus granulosus]EUB59350.1 Kelch-like protein 20 [Echinococcus granulosus]
MIEIRRVVSISKLASANEFCRDLIDEVKACLLLPQERVRIQLCSPLTPKEALFVVSGQCSGAAIASAEGSNPHSRHYGVGVGVISDLYAGERHDGQSYLNSMESMSTYRVGVGVAVLNRLLYADNGSDRQSALATVGHFDPRARTWFHVTSMSAW